MCTSDLAQAAAAIFEAIGHPEYELTVSDSLRRDGSHQFTLTAFNPCPQANPLDMHCAFAIGDEAQAVLAEFAGKLGTSWPLPVKEYRTMEQWMELREVLNDGLILPGEKARVLLVINGLTVEQAATEITNGRALIAARKQCEARGIDWKPAARQQAHECLTDTMRAGLLSGALPVAVTGEAYTVAPVAA